MEKKKCKGAISRWTLENFPQTSYLLVYGNSTASAVKVDDQVLPKLSATEYDSLPAGWEADLAGNRLVIHLPSPQTPPPASRRVIEVHVSKVA